MTTAQVDLAGKIALVTGASRGIGRAIAITLAAHGARVLLVARGSDGLRETATTIAEADGAAHPITIDLRDKQAALQLRAEAERVFGSVQILVNGSGMFGPVQFIQNSDTDYWEETLLLNTIAPYRLCHAFVGPMLAQGWGRIINLSSAAALHRPAILTSAYATSKVALNHLTRFLANEVAGKGVTANVIHPGDVKTEMWADIRDQTAKVPDEVEGIDGYRRWVAEIGAGGGDPVERAAQCVLWLATDDAAHVNGEFVWIKDGVQAPFAAWSKQAVVSAL